MITTIYLILVITTGPGITVEKIPQANMKQCEINKKNFSDKKEDVGIPATSIRYKAHCVVGVKE